MKTDALTYDLPAELIAQHPPTQRCQARLLILDRRTGALQDRVFSEIGNFLRSGDCLVINDTRVRPARFFARRQSGAAMEGLFLGARGNDQWNVLLKGIRKVKPGESFMILGRDGREAFTAEILERRGDGECRLRVHTDQHPDAVLNCIGFPPLPPYILRDGDLEQAKQDTIRYQTVYAAQPGAVAAPTAGLHFTSALLEDLTDRGILTAKVTLHVGVGTFKPIKAERVEDHDIHAEQIHIGGQAVECINKTRQQGGKIVAVGTTSVRCLESAVDGSGCAARLIPFSGPTRLFILPGHQFKLVDSLITNFHLPKSSLLALVGAFADLAMIKSAYQHAIEQRYRFFSYGDAMLIL